MHRRQPSQAGYTLIELMIVVVLIGIVAALAAPSVSRGVRERRKNRAAQTVTRTFQAARFAAIASGAAHLVVFTPNGAGGRGTLEVYRGTTNRCNTTPWYGGGAAAENVVGAGCSGNLRCLRSDSYDPMEYETVGSPYQIQLALTNAGAGPLEICYEGNGVAWWRTVVANAFSDTAVDVNGAQALTGGFTFTVSALVDGDDPGVVRRIIVPLGGLARTLR